MTDARLQERKSNLEVWDWRKDGGARGLSDAFT